MSPKKAKTSKTTVSFLGAFTCKVSTNFGKFKLAKMHTFKMRENALKLIYINKICSDCKKSLTARKVVFFLGLFRRCDTNSLFPSVVSSRKAACQIV